jgi:hypothetical protein
MGECGVAYGSLVGRPEGRGPFEDIGIDERIILKWISYILYRVM